MGLFKTVPFFIEKIYWQKNKFIILYLYVHTYIKKFHCDNDYTFRLRIGSNRAIFEVYKDKIVILVLNIGSRGDIYK